jgi:hypothetical protein
MERRVGGGWRHVLLNMFINSLLAKIPIAQVARNKQALLPFGLD